MVDGWGRKFKLNFQFQFFNKGNTDFSSPLDLLNVFHPNNSKSVTISFMLMFFNPKRNMTDSILLLNYCIHILLVNIVLMDVLKVLAEDRSNV